jgi:hypothetical protein
VLASQGGVYCTELGIQPVIELGGSNGQRLHHNVLINKETSFKLAVHAELHEQIKLYKRFTIESLLS